MVSLEKGKSIYAYSGLSLIDLLCLRRAGNTWIDKIERKGKGKKLY